MSETSDVIMDPRVRFLAEEVMGWHEGPPYLERQIWFDGVDRVGAYCDDWNPFTDLNAAAMVEAKLGEMSAAVQEKYVEALFEGYLELAMSTTSKAYELLWVAATATAEQRMTAALRCLGYKEE